MTVYGYARVSTAEQATGTSVEDQRRVIHAVAHALDTTRPGPYVEMVTDPGVSGSVPFHKRPGGGWLNDMLLPGDVIVVSKLDRAFRSAEDALSRSRELEEKGVDLVIADMGPSPVTRNGAGRLFFTMMAALAEFERERISERTADGRTAKQRSGGFVGGKKPFGYCVEGQGRDARLVEDPTEQAAIQAIATARGEGQSLRAVADMVERDFGVKVSYMTVRRIERDLKEDGEAA